MVDQLEQELRCLIQNFLADVNGLAQQAVLRIIQSAFTGTPRADGDLAELGEVIDGFVANVTNLAQHAARRLVQPVFDGTGHVGETVASHGDRQPSARRPASRRLTVDELTSVGTQLATLIREQPGQTTAQLARALSIPSHKLIRPLRQLKDAGVIRTEERYIRGLWRLTYSAAGPRHAHHTEPLPGSAASWADPASDVSRLVLHDIDGAPGTSLVTLGRYPMQ